MSLDKQKEEEMKLRKPFFASVAILLIGMFLFPNSSYSLRVPSSLNDKTEGFVERFSGMVEEDRTYERLFEIAGVPSVTVPDNIATKTSAFAAVYLTERGLRGAARGLSSKIATEKARISAIKDESDGMAKRIFEKIITEEGIILRLRVSEGFGRDEVMKSFKSNDVVNPTGTSGIDDAIIDVIEGTNPFVTNVDNKRLSELEKSESGATSIIVTGKGVESIGNCPDYYADGIFTIVPEGRRQAFIDNPLDPEETAKDPSKIEEHLLRIAEANGLTINDLEVVVMDRERENERLGVLSELQERYSGLEVVTITDGTVAHSLLATFGRTEGKHKVVMTVGGAPEVFLNLAVSGIFKGKGALASIRVYSKSVNKTTDKANAHDLTRRYDFTSKEKQTIEELRPDDSEAIVKGQKLFTQEDVEGDVEGSFAFITNNGVFGIQGVQKLEDGSYQVKILRVGKVEGEPDAWFEDRVFKQSYIDAERASIARTTTQAATVSQLVKNLSGVLRLSSRGELEIIDEVILRSEGIDYLAREAALNPDKDVKESAQYIIREVGLLLGIKPASNHDFYMAKKEGKWPNTTTGTFNLRAGVYQEARLLMRVVKENNIGAFGFELARSETRYTGQRPGEYVAMGIAAAIREGYEGLLFFIGDHYQVNKDKYFAGGEAREKELEAVKAITRESILGGKYNIDLDPSTLIDQEALEEILAFEDRFVDEHLAANPELLEGLDEPGIKALRYKLVDELELSSKNAAELDALYQRMHKTTTEVTMDLIRYIRGLEQELLGGKITIAIGIEERHIDKKMPSSVRGSITLAGNILEICEKERLVPPCKLALQTGTMHGVGGKIDFGVFERHLAAAHKIGIHVFVQHGTSTIKDREDFKRLPTAGVGEAHLATEYQKIHLGIIASMMPELAKEMARFMEGLMDKDPKYNKKFRAKWDAAFSDDLQRGKSQHEIIVEILSDTLPGKLQGSLKDLAKEISAPFKDKIWNLPSNVAEAVDKALLQEFREVTDMLGARNTKNLVESIVPTENLFVVRGEQPKVLSIALQKAARSGV